jgi:hypothetical protein
MYIKIRHTRALIWFLPIGFRVPITIPNTYGHTLLVSCVWGPYFRASPTCSRQNRCCAPFKLPNLLRRAVSPGLPCLPPLCPLSSPRRRLGYPQPLPLNFFPLYHFPLYFPPIFYLPQRFPLNTPSIPHYKYKISFSISTINFLSTNNYSCNHSTVFRGINSDTLDLGGERRGPTRRGAVGDTAAAVGCPLQAACKVRGCVGAAIAVSLTAPPDPFLFLPPTQCLSDSFFLPLMAATVSSICNRINEALNSARISPLSLIIPSSMAILNS